MDPHSQSRWALRLKVGPWRSIGIQRGSHPMSRPGDAGQNHPPAPAFAVGEIAAGMNPMRNHDVPLALSGHASDQRPAPRGRCRADRHLFPCTDPFHTRRSAHSRGRAGFDGARLTPASWQRRRPRTAPASQHAAQAAARKRHRSADSAATLEAATGRPPTARSTNACRCASARVDPVIARHPAVIVAFIAHGRRDAQRNHAESDLRGE